jgi:hypothetical protein
MRCDLGKIFEKGQAYVALSRATSLETLQILNFRPEKVMSHPRVSSVCLSRLLLAACLDSDTMSRFGRLASGTSARSRRSRSSRRRDTQRLPTPKHDRPFWTIRSLLGPT